MIGKFEKPAIEVEAAQFTDISQTTTLFHWLNGLFIIRTGEDHDLRLASELDEEGTVRRDAPPFLVIRTRSGDDRVSLNDWVVKYDDERLSVYDELSFAFQFTKKGE